MLFKKLIRTLFKYKAQFISMIIMIALGIGVFAGFSGEWYTIQVDCNQVYNETNFSDYRIVNEVGFNETDLNKINEIEGVDEATLYLALDMTSKDNDKVKFCTTTNMNVSSFKVTKGAEYDENNEGGIWLSDRYAKENSISVGDKFDLTFKGTTTTYDVMGLIKSGEFLICVTDSTQIMPDFKTMGYGYVTPKTVENTLGMPFYTQINVISDMSEEDFEKEAFDKLDNSYIVLSKDDTVSYSEANGEIEEGKTMSGLIPVLFLAIAILTMITTMHRITVNEKMQIGILKALGFKDRKILIHYTSYAVFIGIIGSIFGIGVGFLLCWFIMNPSGSMGTYLDLLSWNLYFPWYVWVVTVGVIVLLTLVGFLSVKKMLSGTPADTLRPYVPKKMKSLIIEKTKWFHKRGFAFRWNIRDIFRHKARSLMSIIGVVGCTILLTATFGFKYIAESFISDYYEKPMKYETRINLATDVTNEIALELTAKYDGDVTATTIITIDDELYSIDVYNRKNNLINILDSKAKIMKNVSSDGVYVPTKLAKKLGLKAGDKIKFKTFTSDKEYEVEVLEVVRAINSSIVMTNDLADEIGMDYLYNSIYTKETEIEENVAIASHQSKEGIINSFNSFASILNLMVGLLVIASVILGIVVLYNFGVLGYMERYKELATLKVLGFKDIKISSLLTSQNMWMTVFGMIVGTPLGILVMDILIKLLASDYDMMLKFDPRMFIYTYLLVLLTSLFVSFLVSRKNKHIDMVEALKAE